MRRLQAFQKRPKITNKQTDSARKVTGSCWAPLGSKEEENRFSQTEVICFLEDLCQQLPEMHSGKKGPSCLPDPGVSMALGRKAGFKLSALFPVSTNPSHPSAGSFCDKETDIFT